MRLPARYHAPAHCQALPTRLAAFSLDSASVNALGPQRQADRVPGMKLIIGNKNYSSWSLRGWLAAKQSGLAF